MVDWFWELCSSRTMGPQSPNPLQWSEILAWSEMTGSAPLPWQLRALNSMDSDFIGHFSRKFREQTSPDTVGPPMTSKMFLALMPNKVTYN